MVVPRASARLIVSAWSAQCTAVPPLVSLLACRVLVAAAWAWLLAIAWFVTVQIIAEAPVVRAMLVVLLLPLLPWRLNKIVPGPWSATAPKILIPMQRRRAQWLTVVALASHLEACLVSRQGCTSFAPTNCVVGYCAAHCTSRRCTTHSRDVPAASPEVGDTPRQDSQVGSNAFASGAQCRRSGCTNAVPPNCAVGYCREHCSSARCAAHASVASQRRPAPRSADRIVDASFRSLWDRFRTDLGSLPPSVRDALPAEVQRALDAASNSLGQGEGQAPPRISRQQPRRRLNPSAVHS